MTTGEIILYSSMCVLAVLGSAICSATEISCYGVNRVRLSLRAQSQGDHAARMLARELARPDRVLATILIGNNLVNYILAWAVEPFMETFHLSQFQAILADIIVITPVLLIFGESLPKELARLEPDRLAYRLVWPLAWARTVLTAVPLLPLISSISRMVERAAGLRSGKDDDHVSDTRQRIAVLLKEGATAGVLSESQTTLVDRALALRTVTVRHEMIPWTQVRTIDASFTRERALRAAALSPHSRLPVVGPRGRVVGVIRQIDLYTRPDATIQQLLTEPARLDPEMTVTTAVRELSISPGRVGIVEQHGRPIGIVTSKDLFEPLTGELPDW